MRFIRETGSLASCRRRGAEVKQISLITDAGSRSLPRARTEIPRRKRMRDLRAMERNLEKIRIELERARNVENMTEANFLEAILQDGTEKRILLMRDTLGLYNVVSCLVFSKPYPKDMRRTDIEQPIERCKGSKTLELTQDPAKRGETRVVYACRPSSG